MIFSSLLKPENIILELESTEKDVLFAEMVENIVTTHPSVNRSEALAALTERENKMNTCIKLSIQKFRKQLQILADCRICTQKHYRTKIMKQMNRLNSVLKIPAGI